MTRLVLLAKKEPALVISVIGALVSLLATFGLKLSPDQTKGLYTVVLTLSGWIIRSQVTPSASSDKKGTG